MSVDLTIAAELCRRFEGFRRRPYLCPAGVPTIGYGSTYYRGGRKVTLQDQPISESAASALLLDELHETFLPGVARMCPVLLAPGNNARLNAIVSFTYNLGVGNLQVSTLRRKINAQDWPASRAQLMRWTRAGGNVLPGLVRRRQAEAEFL